MWYNGPKRVFWASNFLRRKLQNAHFKKFRKAMDQEGILGFELPSEEAPNANFKKFKKGSGPGGYSGLL